MKVLIKEKLSPHKSKTPEGYLICLDAILSRTGKQDYYASELWTNVSPEEDKIVSVNRTEKEVFSPEAMASFENKPVTIEHPDENVNPENYKEYSVGFVRDIHKGSAEDGTPVMLGNLIITDAATIEDIENGIRTELSCGYDCDITEGDNPEQVNIRGNHVALCEQGRAGIARIIDSESIKDEIEYSIRNIRGHYEVFANNTFIGSADTMKEAYETINEYEQELKNKKEIKDSGLTDAYQIFKFCLEYGFYDLARKVDFDNFIDDVQNGKLSIKEIAENIYENTSNKQLDKYHINSIDNVKTYLINKFDLTDTTEEKTEYNGYYISHNDSAKQKWSVNYINKDYKFDTEQNAKDFIDIEIIEKNKNLLRDAKIKKNIIDSNSEYSKSFRKKLKILLENQIDELKEENSILEDDEEKKAFNHQKNKTISELENQLEKNSKKLLKKK